jgi:hypothetical protein
MSSHLRHSPLTDIQRHYAEVSVRKRLKESPAPGADIQQDISRLRIEMPFEQVKPLLAEHTGSFGDSCQPSHGVFKLQPWQTLSSPFSWRGGYRNLFEN